MRFETLFKKLSKLQARKVKVVAEDGHDDHDRDRDQKKLAGSTMVADHDHDHDHDQKKLAGSTMVAEHPLPVSNSISLHPDADIETPKRLGVLRRSNRRPHLRHVSFASTPSYIEPAGRICTAHPDNDYVEINDSARAVLLNKNTTNTDGDDDINNGGFGIDCNGRTGNTGVVTLKIVLRKQHYEELLRDGGEGLLDAFLSNTLAIAEGCRWPKDNPASQAYSLGNLIPVP